MPPVPSASYLAPGLVITSMLLTMVAGMALSIWLVFWLSIMLGLPLTYTLKLACPFTEMLSCPSTLTMGTLRSMSSTVSVRLSTSSATE